MIDTAIVLVAGLGHRLKPLTDTVPKCLVEVNGTPILINTLNHLASQGIKEVVLVTGYLDEKIKEKIGQDYGGMKINYVKSNHYATTNNMYSLWLVKHYLEQGVILIEGDSFFEEEILKRLLNTDDKSYWTGDRFDLFKDGCMLTS
ncbi:MAG: NTP transferase domain-containing protein, partial [Nanoarchaeota archaeon]|nr:NTP transferase domain-containing protein [Nanoarchaeota archaeon]